MGTWGFYTSIVVACAHPIGYSVTSGESFQNRHFICVFLASLQYT